MQKVEDDKKSEAANNQETSETPTRDSESESSKGIPEVFVTGSRIWSPAGEQTMQPVLTITSKDIERYGVSSLGELFKYIPQVSSHSTGQLIQTPNTFSSHFVDMTSARVTASLRGAPAGGTLLLINGRRAPKTGQETGADGYDLSGIPLAAIDRIDVLLDGASAIYGADAVGGVINVILKKGYSGTTVRLGYENTFDKDAAVRSADNEQYIAAADP
jgi:iron complex outermembrane receptor protein